MSNYELLMGMKALALFPVIIGEYILLGLIVIGIALYLGEQYKERDQK